MRPIALALVVAMLAGCGAAPPPSATDDGAPGDASRPTWTPVPPGAAEPTLRPDSLFAATPWGYARADWAPPTEAQPTIFYMEGYGGASTPAPTHYLRVRDGTLLALHIMPADRQVPVGGDMPRFPGFTQVRASIRGTGCSAGTFALFDPTTALDGRDVIEWIAAQEWTTPKVGMYGASYSGLTAFSVAATQPPHLAAVAPNLVIDDLYRGIGYPGGVPNTAFPYTWPTAIRPAADAQGTQRGAAAQDELCEQNAAGRSPAPPQDHPSLILATHPYDGLWWVANSLYGQAPRVRAPISIAGGWQDEQTGPRAAPRLFELVQPDPVVVDGRSVVPKRMLTTNGGHGDTAATAYWDDLRWFEAFLKGVDNGVLDEPPVTLRFNTVLETKAEDENFTWGTRNVAVTADVLRADAFPPREAVWTRYHLRQGGALSLDAPSGPETADAYPTGSPRRAWAFQDERADARIDGPDALVYRTEPLENAVVVAGPIAATLFISTTATDTDLFVVVADEHPDGRVTYLQRGLLRASHRALDASKTLYNEAGDVVLPHHPHTSSQPVPLGAVVRYDVEVFPLAHIFYPGHRLRVEVSTPPLVDGLWGYSPLRHPGINTVHHAADAPSSILLATMQWPGALPPEPACGAPQRYSCLGALT